MLIFFRQRNFYDIYSRRIITNTIIANGTKLVHIDKSQNNYHCSQKENSLGKRDQNPTEHSSFGHSFIFSNSKVSPFISLLLMIVIRFISRSSPSYGFFSLSHCLVFSLMLSLELFSMLHPCYIRTMHLLFTVYLYFLIFVPHVLDHLCQNCGTTVFVSVCRRYFAK